MLEKILKLYIRVRSFSNTKDVNLKKKLQSRTTDKKSLWANLKKKSDEEINDSQAFISIYVNFNQASELAEQHQLRH